MRHIHEIKKVKKGEKLAIILLYAGSREKLHGCRALLEINGNHLYEYHLRAIEQRFLYTDHDVIAVTGIEAKQLMDKMPDNVIKVENENFKETSVVRSLGMALRATDAQNVLMIYGDLAFNKSIFDVDFDKSCIWLDTYGKMDTKVGCHDTDNIELLLYNLPNKWSQIAFFTGKELSLLRQICWNESKYKILGFEMINEIIAGNGKFIGIKDERHKITDIDCQNHIKRAKEILA